MKPLASLSQHPFFLFSDFRKLSFKATIISLLIVLLVTSCKQYEPDHAVSEATEESFSSSAATETNNSNRKFIRTADAKFRVKDVAKSTYAIENATTKFGGFVTYTNLQSDISDKREVKISQDSLLETITYHVENNITIRVPNTKMDTVIKCIAAQIDFLDYRIIKADDVSLQLLSNELAQNRSKNHSDRLENAIDKKGKKLNQIEDAEQQLANQQQIKDHKKIDNLALNDQVNFSTLSLYIYQPESVKQQVVVNHASLTNTRPNIGIQIVDGLKTGWYILETIIGFVVQLWSLILLGILVYFVYRKYKLRVA